MTNKCTRLLIEEALEDVGHRERRRERKREREREGGSVSSANSTRRVKFVEFAYDGALGA